VSRLSLWQCHSFIHCCYVCDNKLGIDDIPSIERPTSAPDANDCGCEPCRDQLPRLRAERNRWRLLHDHKQDNNDRLLAALTEVSTSHRHCGRTITALKQQIEAGNRVIHHIISAYHITSFRHITTLLYLTLILYNTNTTMIDNRHVKD
jgi:hypothetical protein